MSKAPHDARTTSPEVQTQKYDGWAKGMDNIHADFELPADTLRDAADVDIFDSGKLRRRLGTTLLSATAAHSLWTNGRIALVYSANALNRLNANDSLSVLVSGLSGRSISYTQAGLDTYWSDGVAYGRISNDAPADWGVEVPALPPGLAIGPGLLDTGIYQAAVSFVTATGEESAMSPIALVSPVAGGLTVTIPQPITAAVTSVNVYLSQPNGDLLYKIANRAVGITSLAVTSIPAYGHVLRGEYVTRFPPCDIIEHWKGRIYGAIGNMLLCTEPFAFGVYRPAKNFYLFPTAIRLIVGVSGGIYVVCDKTYWLQGTNPDDFKQEEIFPFGGARRSSCRVPDSNSVIWFSDRGLALGDGNGKVVIPQAASIAPGSYNEGSTFVREQNSIRQTVSIVRDQIQTAPLAAPPAPSTQTSLQVSTLTATDWMEATVN